MRGAEEVDRVLDSTRATYAGISLPNPPSVTFHTGFGFESIGVYRDVGFKQGQWHDVGWWALRLQAFSAAPDAPMTPESLVDDPRWIAALRTPLS